MHDAVSCRKAFQVLCPFGGDLHRFFVAVIWIAVDSCDGVWVVLDPIFVRLLVGCASCFGFKLWTETWRPFSGLGYFGLVVGDAGPSRDHQRPIRMLDHTQLNLGCFF